MSFNDAPRDAFVTGELSELQKYIEYGKLSDDAKKIFSKKPYSINKIRRKKMDKVSIIIDKADADNATEMLLEQSDKIAEEIRLFEKLIEDNVTKKEKLEKRHRLLIQMVESVESAGRSDK